MVHLQENKEVKEGTGSLLLFSFIYIVLLKVYCALSNKLIIGNYCFQIILKISAIIFTIPKICREEEIEIYDVSKKLQLYLV